MAKHRWLAVVAAVLFAALGGCAAGGDEGEEAGGGGGGGSSGGPPIAKEAAASTWAERFCGALFTCDCADHAGHATEADCVTAETAATQALLDRGDAAGLAYSGDCMARVTSFFADDLACSGELAVFAAGCEKNACGIFAGAATLGQPCEALSASAGSCAQGLWCNPVSSVCEEFRCESGGGGTDAPGLGDVCLEGQGWNTCEPSDQVVCDVAGSGTCVELPARGEPCVSGKCEAGSVCELAPLPDGTCVAPVAQGESCSSSGTCAEGLFCTGNTNQPGTCEPPRADGEACNYPQHCQSGHCAGRFQGTPSGTCAQPLGLGDACGGEEPCGEGLGCDRAAAPPVCVEAGSEGQACREADGGCDDGLVCNGVSCIRLPGEGEPCGELPCAGVLRCVDLTCTAPRALICEVQ